MFKIGQNWGKIANYPPNAQQRSAPLLERQSYNTFSRSTKYAKRSWPYFQDLSNIEKNLNTIMKSWSSNQRLNMIEK